MPMPRPIPTIDHVVVNARERLEAAAAVYRGLGFTLTPKGYHSLGTVNHLAIFGTDYLELIGVPGADSARQDVLGYPIGLNGLVFATDDAAATHAAMAEAEVRSTPPREFNRPVEGPGGMREAVFRTVQIEPQPEGAAWPGRVYFCQHFTRDLVWQDAMRHHPNGAVGVVRHLIASDDPGRLGDVFGRMFGAGAVRAVPGGVSLVAGLARVDVLGHGAVAATLEGAGGVGGRGEYMAALTLRTLSLAQAEGAMPGVPVLRRADRLLVPAGSAFGCALEFVA